MPSPVSRTQVDPSPLQDPVVKANESSGCLDALISKIWSCVQAVLNFLTCGCFSSSSKQESAGSPVDPSRFQQLSQEGKSVGDSQISSRTRLQEPELDQPESSFDGFSDGSSVASSEEDELLVKEVSDTNAATFKDGEKQTRLEETLTSWQEAMYTYSISSDGYELAARVFNAAAFKDGEKQTRLEETLTSWQGVRVCYKSLDQQGRDAKSLVDTAKSLIDKGANLYQCDLDGAHLKNFANSIINNTLKDLQLVDKSELEMVSMLLTAGVELKREDWVIVLSEAIRFAPSSEGSLELLKLFIEKRKEAIVECDREQQLLTTAAMQVNYALDSADTQLEVLDMLLDAGLEIGGRNLKLILWNALEDPSKDHCRKLIIQFMDKRREAVLECDSDHELLELANRQWREATSGTEVANDLEYMILVLKS